MRCLTILAGAFLASTSFALPGQPRARSSTAAAPSSDKLVRFLRERFGLAENIKLTAEPFADSAAPEFLETTVTADDGTPAHKKTQPVYVSKDGRYVVLGKVLPLSPGEAKAEISRDVREIYKLPASTALTVGEPARSRVFPAFNEVKVSTDGGKSQGFFLTRDSRSLIVGNIFPFTDHPGQDVLRAINLEDQPSVGPDHAPVTIVEYADLECPSCARMHQFIEHDLLPKYGDKVRVVFKEFPLVNVHTWAVTAAAANECAYQIDPAAFLPYRSLIFEHQNDVDAVQANSSTVRDLLLTYGQQAGIDRLKLSTCLDTHASIARVEAGYREGQKLSVESTPTFFINGRVLAGVTTPEAFYKVVDDALREAENSRPRTVSRRR